jgi:pentatricopeptide repeat protein
MVIGRHIGLLVVAAATCWIGWVSSAHADWAACQRKPTRACLLEEALRGEGGPLVGKDRLDVLIQGGAIAHPEYVTAADIDEAVRLATTPAGYNYASLAIQGLVAANRTQQAADLVASFPARSATLNLGFSQLVRALARAGDFETAHAVLDRMVPALEPAMRGMLDHARFVQSVRTLAELGRTEDALLVMMTQKDSSGLDVAEMWMTMAQAYLVRGETARARRVLEAAAQILDKDQPYALGTNAEINRWSLICVSALRGDAVAVRTALQQLGPEPTDQLVIRYRREGHQRLLVSLLKTKQFPLALEVAKAAPDAVRDQELLQVNAENALDGRIDDARAVMTLFTEKTGPAYRAGAVRNVALALLKAGKVTEAVDMAAQVSDLTQRKGMLFAMAQALPQ